MSNQFVLSTAFDWLWQRLVPWFATHILQLPNEITVFTNGSGDTTYNYLCLLVYALMAFLTACIVVGIDRHRNHYAYLLQWLIVLVRYYIIFQMLTYGLAKLFYLQFRPPSFTRLIQPYGDSSPMGLLWTFMGYSKGYSIFTGLGEVVGGLLLLVPRFRTLGAIVVFGVMVNVMALNFFYDVPVKILSSHLVLMSLFLIALDGQRLWQLFFTNQATQPLSYPPLFSNPQWIKATDILKWILVGAGIVFGVFLFSNNTFNSPGSQKPPLYGLYEVEQFNKNGVNIPPLLNDSTRWHYLIIEWKGRASIKMMDGKIERYELNADTLQQKIVYKGRGEEDTSDSLFYSLPDDLHLQLSGVHAGDSLQLVLRKKSKQDFLLMNRGFHWINESPFNR